MKCPVGVESSLREGADLGRLQCHLHPQGLSSSLQSCLGCPSTLPALPRENGTCPPLRAPGEGTVLVPPPPTAGRQGPTLQLTQLERQLPSSPSLLGDGEDAGPTELASGLGQRAVVRCRGGVPGV